MTSQIHRSIIQLWPSVEELAADVGVKPLTARGWLQRSSIPARYWTLVLRAAKEREIDVSYDILLAGISARAAA